MSLPIYELLVSEDEDAVVDYVALVDRPAIQKDFMAFNERQRFSVLSEERRIVAGPAMIPDMPIYRNTKDMGEFYVVFSKATIEQAAQIFFRNGYQNNVNLMHQNTQVPGGITFYQSFISDPTVGIAPMKGFEDLPEGTWFMVAKVDNPEVWQQVKDGTFKGFSVEGVFGMKPAQLEMSEEEKKIAEIMEILRTVG
jgi:hypothetical protein